MLEPVTEGDLAKVFAVDRRTVARWLSEGLPADRGAGRLRINLATAVRFVRERDRRTADDRLNALRARLDPEGGRARKVMAEARMKEMQAAEMEGTLVEVADVESTWSQALVSFRESVMSLPANAVQSGLIPSGQEPAIEELCRDALTVLGEHTLPALSAESVRQEER